VPPVAAQAGRLHRLLAAGDAGELVGVDVVEHYASPTQLLHRLLERLAPFWLGHHAVML
jgi:hypothetical protein